MTALSASVCQLKNNIIDVLLRELLGAVFCGDLGCLESENWRSSQVMRVGEISEVCLFKMHMEWSSDT